MSRFEEMFIQSRGKPIKHMGETLVLADYFPTEGSTCFRLTIEVCNGHSVTMHSTDVLPGRKWPSHNEENHSALSGKPSAWNSIRSPGDWRQAVSLRLAFAGRAGQWRNGVGSNNNGLLMIAGQAFDGKIGVTLWQSNLWKDIVFHVSDGAKFIEIYNSWDCGDGVVHSWHNGAAMIVENFATGRRYRCNDGFADDDFNDLIFRVERLVI